MRRKSQAHELTLSDDRLDALFLEVSRQSANIRVDELQKKRVIRNVMDSGRRGAVHGTLMERNRPVSRPLLRVAVAAMLVAGMALLYRLMVEEKSASSSSHFADNTSAKPLRGNGDSTKSHEAGIDDNTRWDIRRLSAGVRMAVPAGTGYQVLPSAPGEIQIWLAHGRICFSKAPAFKNEPLKILTPYGSIHVTGTVLSVEVRKQSTEVKVLEGVVRIFDSQETVHVLKAGNMLNMSHTSAETVPIQSLAGEKWQMVGMGLVAGYDPETDTLSHHAEESDEREQIRSVTRRATPQAVSSVDKPSLNMLHEKVEQYRSAGNWQAAADTYLQLIDTYSTRPESRTAMVALANLYLEKQRKPQLALKWFDRYLQSGATTLQPEVYLGQADAFRMLARPEAEMEVLERVVGEFPQTLYAARANHRLRQLHPQGSHPD